MTILVKLDVCENLEDIYNQSMKIFDASHIHFIGIGGIGTSSLAQILFDHSKIITGSDMNGSEITTALKRKGIKVFIGHDAKNINFKHNLVIYSPAIPQSNAELIKAKELKIPTLSYPEALGQLSEKYYTIAVSGTHGKSTTTAFTALTLINGKLDPTVVIGTKLKEFKKQNYRVGKSKYLVIEACEYKRAFMNLHPDILIITNIEAEHLDYYKNLKDYKNAFKSLCEKVPKNGAIIICSDDKNSLEVTKTAKAKILKYSTKSDNTDFYLDLGKKEIHSNSALRYRLTNADQATKLHPAIPGDFNLKNSANATIVATILKIPGSIITKSIKSYKGSWRRLEYKRTKLKPTIFIDDYGHHPTEIRVTLAAIREKYPDKKILCVFQPHQYSRTYLLLKEFATSFKAVDKLIIPNIYKVRDTEEDLKKVSVEKLVEAVKKHNTNAIRVDGLEKTAEYIKKHHEIFDVIVTMGAGDISKIYKML